MTAYLGLVPGGELKFCAVCFSTPIGKATRSTEDLSQAAATVDVCSALTLLRQLTARLQKGECVSMCIALAPRSLSHCSSIRI
jgi:hypothetical protein